MQHWEYARLVFEGDTLATAQSQSLPHQTVDDTLTTRGAAGWELAGILTDHESTEALTTTDDRSTLRMVQLIFKRPTAPTT